MLKNLPHSLICLRRTLQVVSGTNLLLHLLALSEYMSVTTPIEDERTGNPRGSLKVQYGFERLSGSRGRLTCSGVTGFCDVLCSSSIVFWSYRRSFLHPTRMMGRPWQKCSTSDIHCMNDCISISFSSPAVWRISPSMFCVEGASYLLLHVIQRVGRVDGEADEDDVAVRV